MSTPTPKNRNEAILSGADIEPVNRLEYFLKEAASGGAIPAPTEDDAGKVPVANNDGTASWQTPSGGGGVLVVKATGVCTYTPAADPDDDDQWSVGADKTYAEVLAALDAGTPIYVSFPYFKTDSPYYEYDKDAHGVNLVPMRNDVTTGELENVKGIFGSGIGLAVNMAYIEKVGTSYEFYACGQGVM